MVGSLGTLGLITTATFRLHPLPEEEATLLLAGRTAAGVRALVAAMREAQLEPASVVAVWRDGLFDVAVAFEGFRAGVAEQRERLTRLVRTEAGSACEVLDDAAARSFLARHDELRATLRSA
jgi:glycolate oxidase FAD binding subunit